MAIDPKIVARSFAPRAADLPMGSGGAMLVPQNALRILRRRTGGNVSKATFYRWVNSGKVPSIRLGARILIPWPALEELIRKCFEGERDWASGETATEPGNKGQVQPRIAFES